MRKSFQIAAGVALVLAGVRAFADTGDTASRSAGWNWSAYITVPLFAMAVMYLAGLLRMRARGARLRALPIFCFCSGWLSLFLAIDSPIHEISEQLFWVHMTQHEILMLISAPLLVLSQPAAPLLLALPESWRLRIARFGKAKVLTHTWLVISAPLSAWLLHAAALWVWHAPKLFDATLRNEPVHAVQHISFFGTALLFWWTLFHKHAGSLGYGAAILYVFTTAIHTSVLGALLTFAPRVWYASYARTALLWGFTGLQDQQLGGLIMWIPAGTLLTVVALALLGKWMSHSDTRWEYTRAAALVRASHGATE
jgi:putative membrane protein